MQDRHNNRMQPDFGELRSPQPLMRSVMWQPNLELDYGKIHLTKGPLSGVSSLTVSNNAEDLTLNWFYSAADVNSNADDKICVLVYHPEKDLVLQYDRIASRSDKTATINLPPDFVGEEVLTWATFENETATQVSTSLFTRVSI
mgnify:CR=1 FL=1